MNTRVENPAQPTARVENNAFQLAAALKSDGVGQASDASVKARLGQVLGNLTGGKITSIERLVYFTGKRRQQLEKSLQTEVRAASGGRITNWKDLLGKKPDAANPFTALGNIKLPNGQTVGKTVGSALTPLVKPLKNAPLPGGLSFNQATTIAKNVSRPLPKSVVPPAKGRPTSAAQKPTSTDKPQASTLRLNLLDRGTLRLNLLDRELGLSFGPPQGVEALVTGLGKNLGNLVGDALRLPKDTPLQVLINKNRGTVAWTALTQAGVVVDQFGRFPLANTGQGGRFLANLVAGAGQAGDLTGSGLANVTRVGSRLAGPGGLAERYGLSKEFVQGYQQVQQELNSAEAVNVAQTLISDGVAGRPGGAARQGGVGGGSRRGRSGSTVPPEIKIKPLAVKPKAPNTPPATELQTSTPPKDLPTPIALDGNKVIFPNVRAGDGADLLPLGELPTINLPKKPGGDMPPTGGSQPVTTTKGKPSPTPNTPPADATQTAVTQQSRTPTKQPKRLPIQTEPSVTPLEQSATPTPMTISPKKELPDLRNGKVPSDAAPRPTRMSEGNPTPNPKTKAAGRPEGEPRNQPYVTILPTTALNSTGPSYGGPAGTGGTLPIQSGSSVRASGSQPEEVKSTSPSEPSGKAPKQIQDRIEQLELNNAKLESEMHGLWGNAAEAAEAAKAQQQVVSDEAVKNWPDLKIARIARENALNQYNLCVQQMSRAREIYAELASGARESERLAEAAGDPVLIQAARRAREAQLTGAKVYEDHLVSAVSLAGKSSDIAGIALQRAASERFRFWVQSGLAVTTTGVGGAGLFYTNISKSSNSGISSTAAKTNAEVNVRNSTFSKSEPDRLTDEQQVQEMLGRFDAASAEGDGILAKIQQYVTDAGSNAPVKDSATGLLTLIRTRTQANDLLIRQLKEHQDRLELQTGGRSVPLEQAITAVQNANIGLLGQVGAIRNAERTASQTALENQKNRSLTVEVNTKNREFQASVKQLDLETDAITARLLEVNNSVATETNRLKFTNEAITQYETAKAEAFSAVKVGLNDYAADLTQDAKGNWFLAPAKVAELQALVTEGASSRQSFARLLSTTQPLNPTPSGTITSDSAYQQALQTRQQLQNKINTLGNQLVEVSGSQAQLAQRQQQLLRQVTWDLTGGQPEQGSVKRGP